MARDVGSVWIRLIVDMGRGECTEGWGGVLGGYKMFETCAMLGTSANSYEI